jgi:DNA-binding beta-propeller fold protein YncE
VAVVDTATNQFLGYVTGSGGHSIAVDPNNNNIYVPVTGVGIKVFQPTRK